MEIVEALDLSLHAVPAKRYSELPSHLKFMIDDEQKQHHADIVVSEKHARQGIQKVNESQTPRDVPDHELLQFKTIKNPIAAKKKRANWKAIQVSSKEKPIEERAKMKPVKSQSSPDLIRTARTTDFFTIRAHKNELVDIAKQNMFKTTFDVDNEPILPWKSIYRKPKKVKKPTSPYKLDAGGKGNQDRTLIKFHSERSSKKESSKFQPPANETFEFKTKELAFRPKLSPENYRVLNPSSSSCQLVHSKFLQLPDNHLPHEHLHESDAVAEKKTKADQTARQRRGGPALLVDTERILQMKSTSKETLDDVSDSDTELTDSLSVKDNVNEISKTKSKTVAHRLPHDQQRKVHQETS